MNEEGDDQTKKSTAPLLATRMIINGRGENIRRCDDLETRRAMVTLLTARLARNRPIAERTLEALAEKPKLIAGLLGDPSCAYRRQDAERSALIGGIYRRLRFGHTAKPKAAVGPYLELQRRYELERRRRISAETRAKKIQDHASDRRLKNAVAIIKETELRWSLSSRGKASR